MKATRHTCTFDTAVTALIRVPSALLLMVQP